MKALFRKWYQIVRYGAVQKPLPDWSKVRIVALVNGFTQKQFGSYDRQTHVITFDESYHLTQEEQEQYTQMATSTDKARIIVPLHL